MRKPAFEREARNGERRRWGGRKKMAKAQSNATVNCIGRQVRARKKVKTHCSIAALMLPRPSFTERALTLSGK